MTGTRQEIKAIRGMRFLVGKAQCNARWTKPCVYGDILMSYRKPSEAKRFVWNKWVNWAKDLESLGCTVYMHIESANSQTFTIGGYLKMPNGDEYNFYVTRWHKRIYPICRK